MNAVVSKESLLEDKRALLRVGDFSFFILQEEDSEEVINLLVDGFK